MKEMAIPGNFHFLHIGIFPDSRHEFPDAEGGLVVGSADEGFGYFDVGIEWKPLKDFPMSPFTCAGGGILIEPEYMGPIF